MVALASAAHLPRLRKRAYEWSADDRADRRGPAPLRKALACRCPGRGRKRRIGLPSLRTSAARLHHLACTCMSRAPMLRASEPGIFAEVVSISSTRSADVSDSAYFIKSIELRPTFDLFLGASRGLHFIGRVSSGETLIWAVVLPRSSVARSATRRRRGPTAAVCVGWDAAECYRR